MVSTPEDRRAKLAELLRQKAQRSKVAPLSFAQERMWFLAQLAPDDPGFNMVVAVRLAGKLDVAALEASLDQVVRRHESLRTTFADQDGVPVQVINPATPLSLSVRELGTLPEAEREAHVQQLAAEEARRPCDLARGPLFCASLLRLSEEQHVLLMKVHHLVSDGWSQAVLLRELAALYQAFVAGKPAVLPVLPVQYADFATWQRQSLETDRLQAQWEYWRERLAGPLPALEMIAARPPGGGSARPIRRSGTLPLPLKEALNQLSQQAGVTLFVTLLGAFKVLLHRYTGQTDIVVGTPIANRDRLELEGLVGLFLNTLVLRTDLEGAPTFLELLGRARRTVVEAFEHKDLPFEQLVAKLRPDRNLGRNALFQATFVMQGARALPELPGLALSLFRLELDSGAEAPDVVGISLQETPEGLAYFLEYQAGVVNDRILEHYRVLLEGVAADPQRSISTLPLLESSERERLLMLGNEPRGDYPAKTCLQELVEAQAQRTPEAVALTFEGRSLTYRELDARANQLAHQLRTLGVGRESRVGVCLERSLEMVVGLLGILKAGGAYVPLEPSYPRERLGWLLEDTRPAVLLAHERLLARLPPHGAQVVCLDPGWDELARQPEHRPAPLATADNLAYVIFTSGSTGRPKGAMNVHRAVCNRLLWMQDAYGLNESDVVLQKTPFGFDVSVWEFFWPLMTGARLVLARPGGHQEPAYLLRLIVEEGVTTLHFVPSMLQVFLEEAGLERCTSLRRVVCSGEALPVELKERCLERLPWAALHNLYGPTEAAVDVMYHACQRGDGRHSVPIGRPVANTSIRILDANLEPVPAGVPGGLYIGGVQVGRGYLGRPELTAECFIPDVFADTPGARLYRTGDVARWSPDGSVEFLGRADFQVKLRGLRIELGEIEAALGQHPAIRQAVVVVREDEPGDRRLVAYVVARPGAPALDAGELRHLLQERLPEYMVPSAFVVLEALPLGSNGKIDRRALPAPAGPQGGHSPAFVAPESAVEKKLAEIWSQVLKVEPVGVLDNFFEVGGHSLLATQIVSRVNQAFQISLPVQSLFQDPTIAGLALQIEEVLLDELEGGEHGS